MKWEKREFVQMQKTHRRRKDARISTAIGVSNETIKKQGRE